MYISIFVEINHVNQRVAGVRRFMSHMGWLRLVGSLRLQVSLAKEPHKTDDILQKRFIDLRSLLIVATPYTYIYVYIHIYICICIRVLYVCTCAYIYVFSSIN